MINFDGTCGEKCPDYSALIYSGGDKDGSEPTFTCVRPKCSEWQIIQKDGKCLEYWFMELKCSYN